jgi:hypothetical protein
MNPAIALLPALFATLHASQDGAPAAPVAAAQAFVPVEARDTASLSAHLESFAKSNAGRASLRVAAKSPVDRPIHLLTLSEDVAKADAQPAILVLAGMDGHRWASTEAALALADGLVRTWPAGLAGVTVHVVPRGNPDPAEAFARGIRRAYSGDGISHDNDKDGPGDEDPPRDLNGDGLVTQMRKAGEAMPWTKPSLVTDPADARLMRAPKSAEGELPTWTVWTEGIDADADGRIGEDWVGGIDPERNFPHRWPEFEDETGVYPLLAPESKWLADFVITHPQVIAALVLGRHDTVVNVPDARQRTPHGMPWMIDESDAAAYGELAKAYREITGQSRASGADTSGSFVAWMNAQRGIPTFATTLWGRPDLPDAPKPPEGTPAPPTPADPEEAAWLRYSDEMRGGRGFVPWTKQPHPQLFEVEVGGWVPGFRENPPIDQVAPAAAKHVQFLERIAGARAKVTLAEPTVTALGPGLWRVETSISNTGRLPTVMRGGRAEGVAQAHVVRISVPVDRIRSGKRVQVMRGLDAGAQERFTWIVSAAQGEPVTVEVVHAGRIEASHVFVDGKRVSAAGVAEGMEGTKVPGGGR